MRKFLMMGAAVAVAATTMISCKNGGDVKADLQESVDTLAYDLGLSQVDGLKQYMTMNLGVDTTYMDDFMKGMKEGALKEDNPAKLAYMQGLQVGKQIKQMADGLTHEVYGDDSTKSIKVVNLLAGITDGLKGKATKTAEEAFNEFNALLAPIKKEAMMKQYGDNKAAGEKYMLDNSKKEGVKTLPSGVQYKVLVEGTGALPTDTTTLQVNYEGRLIDGTVFDSSYERNMPLSINMAMPRVIQGWVDVLKVMPAGSTWEVTIPQELAYGEGGQGPIKPFSALIFKIEVLN